MVGLAVGVAGLAAATLLLESTLLRLLAVAQYYHFAFLAISLALLGFAASGSALALFPRLSTLPPQRLLAHTGLGFVLAEGLALLAVFFLPFDSYRIAWEPRQGVWFALYYLALSMPFLAGGLGLGAVLRRYAHAHRLYAANLIGSGLGALLTPWLVGQVGLSGALLVAGMCALLPTAVCFPRRTLVLLLLGGVLVAQQGQANRHGRAPVGAPLSPYKALAQARHYPEARPLWGEWTPIARWDVWAFRGEHALPGMSYACPAPIPPQVTLFRDGDTPRPITRILPADFAAADCLPEAGALAGERIARALVLAPGGGLAVLQALHAGADQVTVLSPDARLPGILSHTAGRFDPFHLPGVRTVVAAPRAWLARPGPAFDRIFLPLDAPYRPVSSGAFSLSEHFLLTREAVAAMLARLTPDGRLVLTRYLQTPPSEGIRLLSTVAAALTDRGLSPAQTVVAWRSLQTLTVVVRPAGWPPETLHALRAWLEARRFDLLWAPDLRPDEVNRFNVFPQAEHEALARALLTGRSAQAWRASPFDLRPPTDDHPFFYHFFTWRQTPAVLAALGHTWQPFGGSGFFVLFLLLAFALLWGGGLVLLPLARRRPRHPAGLPYFALIGCAYLWIEVPVVEKAMLVFGESGPAFAVVVPVLLIASGVGSALTRRYGRPLALPLAATLAAALLVPLWDTLRPIWPGWAEPWRTLTALALLFPPGLLMGMAFPLGLQALERHAPDDLPWAWGLNGFASVLASILAALLALTWGFDTVLLLGALAYLVAWGALRRMERRMVMR